MRGQGIRFMNLIVPFAGAVLLAAPVLAVESDAVAPTPEATPPKVDSKAVKPRLPASAAPHVTDSEKNGPPARATLAPQPTAPAKPPVSATLEPKPPAPPKPQVAAEPGTDDVLAQAIKDRLGEPAGDLDATRKLDFDALAALYKARASAPIWVTSKGFTERAKLVIAEISRADDYGLESRAFDLPSDTTGRLSAAELADADIKIGLAALKYANHARGGRMLARQLSKHLDRPSRTIEPHFVLVELLAAPEPDAYLRSLHPKHRQFEMLRQELLRMRKGQKAQAKIVKMPAGPVLKLGTKHPHVALLRKRLKVAAGTTEDGSAADPKVFDEELKTAVKAYQKSKGLKTDGVVGSGTRRALNNFAAGNPLKLIVNMEQWRWMPDDLGRMHIWANIPEYRFRIVKDGKVVHAERIIVGKYITPTPVFSDSLEMVIFQPRWGVPDSIKVNELLPSLRHSTSILRRQNLQIFKGGRRINPDTIDWSRTDPRNFSFIQPSGPRNALGLVKFRFPNKHHVYMHDTPTKHLFRSSVRSYSHGCVRVRNPQRFAEVILSEDKGWSSSHVGSLMARKGGENTINLNTHYPVHLTYFTALADASGKIKYFKDIYRHEKRIALGLQGKGAMVARLVPHPVVKPRKPRQVASTPSGGGFAAWLQNVFGDN